MIEKHFAQLTCASNFSRTKVMFIRQSLSNFPLLESSTDANEVLRTASLSNEMENQKAGSDQEWSMN